MRQEGVELEDGEDLGGDVGGETGFRVYYMKKIYFFLKKLK